MPHNTIALCLTLSVNATTTHTNNTEQQQRVDGLVAQLERVPFDIFDRKYKDSWHMVMQQFRRAVEEIESMTKSFIEQSFQKLRSAEGAFELVQNFKNIQVEYF